MQIESEMQPSVKRILVCVTGMSPQIVTETLFALARTEEQPWLADEVHLITTTLGANSARLNLLHPSKNWLRRWAVDYGYPVPRLDDSTIHVIRDAAGNPLADIRTQSDNECAADLICSVLQQLTADPNVQLHVSIAGGRKTMGYYAGYALSLFGRPEDTLSHVLVSAEFENAQQFFYPTPYPLPIDVRIGEKTLTLDAQTAQVSLAKIPFVRLRSVDASSVVAGAMGFSAAVRAAQQALTPKCIDLDFSKKLLQLHGIVVKLPPALLTLYTLFAIRAAMGRFLLFSKARLDKIAAMYHELYEAYDFPRAKPASLTEDSFLQYLSKLNRAVADQIPMPICGDYQIVRRAEARGGLYGANVDPANVHILHLPISLRHRIEQL